MTNYPTKKTNIRLQSNLIEAVRRRTDNANGWIKDALSTFLRSVALKPSEHADDIAFMVHRAKVHHMSAGWGDDKTLTTMRLREIDLSYCKLNCYDLSRTVRLAINYKLRQHG